MKILDAISQGQIQTLLFALLFMLTITLSSCSLFSSKDSFSCSDLVVTDETGLVLEMLGDPSDQWRIMNSDIEPVTYELEGREYTSELQVDSAYPNPVRNKNNSRFSYVVPKTLRVFITISHASSRYNKTLVDNILPEGRHEVQISFQDLPNGCYKVEYFFDESDKVNAFGLIKVE